MTPSQNSQPSGHTPGPWKRERLCIFCPNGSLIAEVHEDYFTHTAEDEANARLIASAPDMLQALRRAVLALAFAAESSPAMQDDYEAVSAAIAKATGIDGASKAQGATK